MFRKVGINGKYIIICVVASLVVIANNTGANTTTSSSMWFHEDLAVNPYLSGYYISPGVYGYTDTIGMIDEEASAWHLSDGCVDEERYEKSQ